MALRADDFDAFFVDRRERLCQLVEKAMGKAVQRDVDEGHSTESSEQFEPELEDRDPDDGGLRWPSQTQPRPHRQDVRAARARRWTSSSPRQSHRSSRRGLVGRQLVALKDKKKGIDRQGVRPPRSAGAAADADREHPAQRQAWLVPVRRRNRPSRAGVTPASCARPATTGPTTKSFSDDDAYRCLDTAERLLAGDRRRRGGRRGQGDPARPAPR